MPKYFMKTWGRQFENPNGGGGAPVVLVITTQN